jgi:hypothetical protein
MDLFVEPRMGLNVMLHYFIAESLDFSRVPLYTSDEDEAARLLGNVLPGWQWKLFLCSEDERVQEFDEIRDGDKAVMKRRPLEATGRSVEYTMSIRTIRSQRFRSRACSL